MSFLDQSGVVAFWAKVKSSFGSRLKVSGTTISLENRADTPVVLSQATIPDATTSAAGAMSASDKVKLNGVAVGANKTVVDAALSTASLNPVQNKAVAAELTGLTDAEVLAACPPPGGSEEIACDSTPVKMWLLMDPGASPAQLFGGSWAMRTDTYLFMGCCIWKRVS